MSRNCKISVVVSAYNEEQALPHFYQAITDVMKDNHYDYELLFIDDGSTDGTEDVIKSFASKDKRVKGISFSRNFGHEAAMIAGIDHAGGDYIICMDSDMQHPVECVPAIVDELSSGVDIVTMARLSNESAGRLKNAASAEFYRLMKKLGDSKINPGVSDFFGMNKKVADVLRHDYREKVRFLRGYIQNAGFCQVTLSYDAKERIAGTSKYDYRKLCKLATDTIVSFTDKPLKFGLYAGCIFGVITLITFIITVINWIVTGSLSGYAALAVLILLSFTVLFVLVGILGTYMSVMLEEIKNRPIYTISETINIR